MLVMIMKRVKRQAMFRPSWKFEGKPHLIPPQFFVLGFRVLLGGLRFRGLRFLGGLRFRGLRSSFSRHPIASTSCDANILFVRPQRAYYLQSKHRELTRLSGKLLLKDRSFEIHFGMSDVKLPEPSIYTFVTSVTELLNNNRLTCLLLFDCSINVKLIIVKI